MALPLSMALGGVQFPAYRIAETYDWNYAHAPGELPDVEVPEVPGGWTFCGMPVDSPLGMPAGPLLNSAWILYYSNLGFDVLTYKTVRSSYRPCYDPPNLLPIAAGQLTGMSDLVTAGPAVEQARSWAISFGMPSKDPPVWQMDFESARKALHRRQVLVVSVVATPDDNWTLEKIAADFARCAKWAKEAGADAIEANLSCPNVCTREGQLYTSPDASLVISSQLRNVIGQLPLILKIGLFSRHETAQAFIEAVQDSATALSTVNSISASVQNAERALLFGGLPRGIGGECIKDRSRAETEMLHDIIVEAGSDLKLIGVGGVSSAADVRERMRAGAHHVQVATAAMLDPMVGCRIRRDLARAFDGSIPHLDAAGPVQDTSGLSFGTLRKGG